MINPELLIWSGGLVHLPILAASTCVPFVLDWRRHFAPLHGFLRRLFWVYGAFIYLVVLGFGLLSLSIPADLADGSVLARSVSGFIALFWLARLAIQFFVFDTQIFQGRVLYRVGYHGLTVAFIYLVMVFGWVALAT